MAIIIVTNYPHGTFLCLGMCFYYQVSMDISIGSKTVGTLTFGLYQKQAPKTVKNFITVGVVLVDDDDGVGYSSYLLLS